MFGILNPFGQKESVLENCSEYGMYLLRHNLKDAACVADGHRLIQIMADGQDGEMETGDRNSGILAIVPTTHETKSGDPSRSPLELAFSGRGRICHSAQPYLCFGAVCPACFRPTEAEVRP